MLLKRWQIENSNCGFILASTITIFCLLGTSAALANTSKTHSSDIEEVELLTTQKPEESANTASQETTEEDKWFWGRITGFISDVQERVKNGARIVGYTGAKIVGDAGKAIGVESVEVLGTTIDIGVNVERDVKSILQIDALAKYFPDQNEIDAIAKEIDERVRSEAFNGVITDEKAVRALEIAVRETSARIADRILEAEGVKDETRRKAWHSRLFSSFESCVSSAKTYFDAQDCKQTFASEAPANLTLATVYEVAREELKDVPGNPAKETAKMIKSSIDQCWKQGQEIEENADCLRQGARQGIREVATKKIDSVLPTSIRTSNPELRSELVENFIGCVSNEAVSTAHAHRREGVLQTCKREIALIAGKRIGESTIPSEIESFIQKRGGLEALQMTSAEKERLVKSVMSDQEKCLNNSTQTDPEKLLESCIGKSIQDVSLALGVKVLDQRAREALGTTVDESIRNEFRDDLAKCVSNITIKNYRESIDACEQKLTRDYTVKVARQAIKDVLEDGLPDDPQGRSIIEGKLEKQLNEIARANDPQEVDRLVADLKRSAAFEIATRAVNQEAQKQFGSKKLPKEFTNAETNLKKEFKKCLAQSKVPPTVCAKQYASAIIKKIASIKLRAQIAEFNKANKLKANPKLRSDLENYFNTCIDRIQTNELNEEFKAAVEACVAEVEKKGFVLIAKNEVMPKVTAQTKNAATRQKTEMIIEEAVECLSELNGLGLASNNKSGNIKDLLKTVQAYFEYDPNTANRSLEAALQDIKKDLEKYGSEAAQERLIDNLARHGVIDQLLKASIRDQVKEGFHSIKASDLPSRRVLNQILQSNNFNKIFTPSVMAKIRPMFIDKVLKPVLLQGKSMNSREVLAATSKLKNEVSLILAQSPHFGRMIANASVQKQLNQLDGMTRFFAHMMYGERALNWDRVPDSPAKRKAQSYIQNELIYPKIAGKTLSRAEEARRHKIAQDLVTEAIKSPPPSPRGRRVAHERECRFDHNGRVVCGKDIY